MVQGAENDLKDIRYYTNTSKVEFLADNEPVEDLNDNVLTVDNKAVLAKNLATQGVSDFRDHQGEGGTAAHADVTEAVTGFMGAADKLKLDQIQPEAQINILPPTDALELVSGERTVLHTHISVSTVNDGMMLATDKTKFDGIAPGAEVNNISAANANILRSSPGGDANSLHTHATPSFFETFRVSGTDGVPAGRTYHNNVNHSTLPNVPPAFPGFTKADEMNISPDQLLTGQTIYPSIYSFNAAVVNAGLYRIRSINWPYGWGGNESFTIDDITLATDTPAVGQSTGTVTFAVRRVPSPLTPGLHVAWLSLGEMAVYQSAYAD